MQQDVLATIDDPALRAYIAWVPILPGDSASAARESSALVTDARVAQFWDAAKALPPLFAPVLGLPEGWPAWDVYMAYGPGPTWGSAPAFWHHQLGDEPQAPTLDGPAFATGVRALLKPS